jgi:hypothetical protein
MEAKIDEIGDKIYRLSVFVPDVAPPLGFTYNHFLIRGDEPLLFHCGRRKLFPLVSGAVAKIIPLDCLRWLTFGHFEADECGSMNEWLAAAPEAQLAHGVVGCRLSVADLADRSPRVLSDGEVIDIGGKRLRYIDTPHVPHGWDAGVLFEETTSSSKRPKKKADRRDYDCWSKHNNHNRHCPSAPHGANLPVKFLCLAPFLSPPG